MIGGYLSVVFVKCGRLVDWVRHKGEVFGIWIFLCLVV